MVIILAVIIIVTIIIIVPVIIIEKLFIRVLTIVFRFLAGRPHLVRGRNRRRNKRASPVQRGRLHVGQQIIPVLTRQRCLSPDNSGGFGLFRLVSAILSLDLERLKLIVKGVRPAEAGMVHIVGAPGEVPAVGLVIVVCILLGIEHAVAS